MNIYSYWFSNNFVIMGIDVAENQLLQHCRVQELLVTQNRFKNRFSRMLYHHGMTARRGHEETLHSFQKSTLHFCNLFSPESPFTVQNKQEWTSDLLSGRLLRINLFVTLNCIMFYIFSRCSEAVAKNSKSSHRVCSFVRLYLRMEYRSFYDIWYSIFVICKRQIHMCIQLSWFRGYYA